MRADAQKNHDKIVATAIEVFTEKGMDAPLDEIATRADVGPGTLYRHFPTREDLIDAVIKSWVLQIETAADDAVASDAPVREVLLRWFSAYVARISRNKGGPAKFTSAMGNSHSPIFSKCEVLRLANERVLDRFRHDGVIRADVDSLEVCRIIGGVAVVADQAGLDEAATVSMLGVVIDGLLRT
ncbi:MAG: TetR/AcrR family transcriptional regulator [Actinomycetota bacterium]|nr:TetR/AcrR family transcriptional regulator [Actinomycetota bacterium]